MKKYLQKLSIKNHLSLIIFIMFSVSVVIALFDLNSIKESHERLKDVNENRFNSLIYLGEIRNLGSQNRLYIANSIIFPQEKSSNILKINNNINKIESLWHNYTHTYLTNEEKIVADKCYRDRQRYLNEGILPAINYLDEENTDALKAHIIKNIHPLLVDVTNDIDKLIELQETITKQHYEISQAQYQYSIAVSVVLQFLGLIIGSFIALNVLLSLKRRLGQDLNYVDAVVKEIAAGNLSFPITLKSNDKKSLLYSISELQKTLGQIIHHSNIVMSEVAKGDLQARITLSLEGDFVKFKDDINHSLELLSNTLNNVKVVAEAIVDGNFNAGNLDAMQNTANNQIGAVMNALKVLQTVCFEMEQQRWVKLHIADIFDQIHQTKTFAELAHKLLYKLCPLLKIGYGGLYVLTHELLVLSGSFPSDGVYHKTTFGAGEGLVGQCLIGKKALIVDRLPSDYFAIASGLGKAQPTRVMLLPIINHDLVLGVLELALFEALTPLELNLLESIMPMMANEIDIITRNIETQSLLKETQVQAAQLSAQTSEMAHQQQKLETTKAWFHSIIESAPDSLIVVDRAGIILLCNESSEEVFGYKKSELEGLNIDDLVPHYLRKDHYKNREKFISGSAKKYLFSNERGNIKGVRKDNSEFSAEISLSLIPSLDGKDICVCVAVRDASERVESNKKLTLANYQNELALDLAKAGSWHIALSDPECWESSERTAKLLGDITMPEWRYSISYWFANCRAADEKLANLGMAVLQAVIEGKQDKFDMIFAYKRPVDNNIIWLRSLGHITLDNEGKPSDIYGLCMDITEHKRNQDALYIAKETAEEATRMKSDFLANMSHEIRTPMNAIIGMSNLVLTDILDEQSRNYVQKIQSAGKHLLSIVNDVLDFSKIEAGELTVESEFFDLDKILKIIADLVFIKVAEKGIELIFNVDAQVPSCLKGDSLRLSQVLINYLNNAIKFTPQGEVVLSIKLLEESADNLLLHFSVRDTGIGLTPKQQDQLFQAFHQADTSTSRQYGGTGLGLIISKKIVHLMGGEVGVSSEFGHGSTFWFTARLQKAQEKYKKSVPFTQKSELNVLVVDDNDTALQVLASLLTRIGFQVTTANSGEQALAQIDAFTKGDAYYKMIFLDWQMPTMSGLDTAKKIQRLTLKNAPHIVIVTGFGREEVSKEAHSIGIDHLLTKPVCVSALFDMSMRILGKNDMPRTTPSNDFLFYAQKLQHLAQSRILLVEDNKLNQEIAGVLLERVGLHVDVANNGLEALEKVTCAPYDIVFMDMQMPIMDGVNATIEIRRNPSLAQLPIVAMTANAMQQDREMCMKAGMNDFISKPIDPNKVIETLLKWIKTPATPLSSTLPPPLFLGIEGLDVTVGLNAVLGDVAVYYQVLAHYSDNQKHIAQDIRTALTAGNLLAAQQLAHSAKGVSGSIGAVNLQELAGELEKRIQANHAIDELYTLLSLFETAHSRFMFALNEVLSHPNTSLSDLAAFDATTVSLVLNTLKTMLQESDGESFAFFETHKNLLKTYLSEDDFTLFKKNMAAFNFKEARHLVDNYTRVMSG